MSYADSMKGMNKPECWGNPNAYDPDDRECMGCAYRASCARDAGASASRQVHVTTPNRRNGYYGGNTYRRDRYGRHEAQDEDPIAISHDTIIEETETPFTRFMKDVFVGGLRGVSYESYQFWKNFRFK